MIPIPVGMPESCRIRSLMTVNGNSSVLSLLKCSVAVMDCTQWVSYLGKYSSCRWLSFVISNLRFIVCSFFRGSKLNVSVGALVQ